MNARPRWCQKRVERLLQAEAPRYWKKQTIDRNKEKEKGRRGHAKLERREAQAQVEGGREKQKKREGEGERRREKRAKAALFQVCSLPIFPPSYLTSRYLERWRE
ncbi:hypothetical protein CGRA01v4_07078 [Colletotrichum graminicola]|nr:hypothetical protein CGRA01v4_07078 [Colletotrichum graminicola]